MKSGRDVSMGQVGAVFALEVSRLARSNLDLQGGKLNKAKKGTSCVSPCRSAIAMTSKAASFRTPMKKCGAR